MSSPSAAPPGARSRPPATQADTRGGTNLRSSLAAQAAGQRFAELLLRGDVGAERPVPAGRASSRPERREAPTQDSEPRELALAPPAPGLSDVLERPDHTIAAASHPPAADLQRLADEVLRRATVVELPTELAMQLELQVPLLRHVGVELRLARGRLRACFQASDRAGFERLRSAIPELEDAFRRRGLLADRVEVRLHAARPAR